jgi:hypothetical protein
MGQYVLVFAREAGRREVLPLRRAYRREDGGVADRFLSAQRVGNREQIVASLRGRDGCAPAITGCICSSVSENGCAIAIGVGDASTKDSASRTGATGSIV